MKTADPRDEGGRFRIADFESRGRGGRGALQNLTPTER